MALDYQRRPITVEQYHLMGEAGVFAPGERVELLDGELIAMAPIGHAHNYGVRRLSKIFIPRFLDRALVDIGLPVVLDDISEPQPDVTLLRLHPTDYHDATPRASDALLVVEVSDSSLRYDRGRKLHAYARTGIPEVWIVDVQGRRVERYVDLVDVTYETHEVVAAGGTLAPRAFPDDAISVDDFLP